MNKESLKKALLRGIPSGIGIALLYVVIRMLLSGGGFFDHLFSVYGILTLVCTSVAWVYIFYNKYNANGK